MRELGLIDPKIKPEEGKMRPESPPPAKIVETRPEAPESEETTE